MDKENVVYNTTKYNSTLKKKKTLHYAITWMNLEDIMLNKKLVTEGQILRNFTYIRYLK